MGAAGRLVLQQLQGPSGRAAGLRTGAEVTEEDYISFESRLMRVNRRTFAHFENCHERTHTHESTMFSSLPLTLTSLDASQCPRRLEGYSRDKD